MLDEAMPEKNNTNTLLQINHGQLQILRRRLNLDKKPSVKVTRTNINYYVKKFLTSF